MNLDKIIKIKMIELTKKYDISLVEISKVKDGKVKKVINFNYRPLKKIKGNSKSFYNKQELVRWLVCLE